LKILAVSDMVVDRLYSNKVAEHFRDVDIILGCGDLPYYYLEFLVSSLNIPLLYIPGNHDPMYDANDPTTHANGGELIDRGIQSVKGLNIAGIGGSHCYKMGCANQYTQNQMFLRLSAFAPRLLWYLQRHGNILDICIAHSPPRGIHDDNDQAHIGFTSFLTFIKTFKPRYFLHGHTIMYKTNLVEPVTQVGATMVINIYPYRLIEIDPVVA
jgi:Icc-related predicted phosphoesterase